MEVAFFTEVPAFGEALRAFPAADFFSALFRPAVLPLDFLPVDFFCAARTVLEVFFAVFFLELFRTFFFEDFTAVVVFANDIFETSCISSCAS